jgi:hypothetical protein
MIDTLPYWAQAVIIFSTQILFIYFRTLNVTYNAKQDRFGVFWTGTFVYFTWLVGLTFGANSLLKGDYFLIICGLAGGLLGADWAITNKFKRK